ncbi:MAG: hemolysin family protein [Abditibacteriales bacterium]|nr:hemolysin family protein [Abditibacteriales bacterium]
MAGWHVGTCQRANLPTFYMETAWKLLAVAALVFANAFFVAAEFALVSVRRSRMEELAAQGVRLAKVVQRATADLDRYIAGTQLGITIASLGLGWIGETTMAHLLEPWLQWLPQTWKGVTAHSLAVTVAFIAITFMHVVLGELVPKSLALQNPDRTALWVAKPMEVCVLLMRPFIAALNGCGNLVLRALHLQTTGSHHLIHSVEELKILIEASHEGGVLDAVERDMLRRVFRFSELIVREVMVHRMDIEGVEVNTPYEELMQIAAQGSHTRLPVYEGNIDNIIGVLYIRDLLQVRRGDGSAFNLRQLLRKPLLVGETMSVENLLNAFRRERTQMAIVVDEFGGTAGIVTLEDVIEEIVGEVQDEFDKEEPVIVERADGTAIVSGQTRLDEINERFDLNLEAEDVDTIGGFVMSHLGRLCRVGDALTIDGVELRVEEIRGRRVRKVLLRKQVSPSVEDADDADA